MPISDQGQLDLSTFEQLREFQDSLVLGQAVIGPFPDIAADPADGSRSVTRMVVDATTGTSPCGIRYSFQTDQNEVWLEFEVRYTHPASASAGAMTLLTLLNRPGDVVAALTRLTDSSMEWRAVDATSPSSFTFSSPIAKDTWERIRLRYKTPDGGSNGILQAWRYDLGTADYVQVLNVTNANHGGPVRRFVIQSGPTDAVRSAAGNKTAWFRGLTWGQQQSHVGMKHHGLQFGHVCSSGSSSTTVDAKLWYRFPREYHGTSIGGVNDPPEVTVQFQYMLATGSSWSNAGSAVNLIPDDLGEMTAVGTATGPFAAYRLSVPRDRHRCQPRRHVHADHRDDRLHHTHGGGRRAGAVEIHLRLVRGIIDELH